jgi:hypothetical protein
MDRGFNRESRRERRHIYYDRVRFALVVAAHDSASRVGSVAITDDWGHKVWRPLWRVVRCD